MPDIESPTSLRPSLYSGAARQRSSDQEVISFLDGRVQELESALQSTADRFSELQEQHGKDKLMSQEQVCMYVYTHTLLVIGA